ncbi:helix-turn-helix transcriptional regulator [Fusibacter bizertensis]|uniref:Helix-turn-helix transcriptional regulator n=1 Tax=Fusibacter bizertensis TaxID=1488331 RepID=A0ABT6NDY9_9FIRM|nr:helix-turn-helix transcriptional regulator [Fusibacter bizertensis]MDH8678649.1 helix-turn-helix transcriptional regulator [Fusibacter bizertensis]
MEVIKIRNNTQSNLKAYRKMLGMTLEDVANVIGVNKTTIQRYESGSIPNIPIETVKALSRLYNVSTNELLEIPPSKTQKDLFIRFIKTLDFKCIHLNSKNAFTAISSESLSNTSIRIQTPYGDDYEVSEDDLINLKASLQDYLSFQLFKLNKNK